MTENVLTFDAKKVVPNVTSANTQILVETTGTAIQLTGNVETKTGSALTMNANILDINVSQIADGASITVNEENQLVGNVYHFDNSFTEDIQTGGVNNVSLALAGEEG